jgi:hypothetical protein
MRAESESGNSDAGRICARGSGITQNAPSRAAAIVRILRLGRNLMIPKIVLLMALGASVIFWNAQRTKGVEIRSDAAQDWSSEASQFVAIGEDSDTLLVVLPDADPVSCDVYLDNLVSDKQMRWEMKSRGFVAVKCLDRGLVLTK